MSILYQDLGARRPKTEIQRVDGLLMAPSKIGASQAMTSSNAPLWKEAISSEIESIMHNQIWEIVDLPSGAKTIGCKWIFIRKLNPYGFIKKYKTRLLKVLNKKKV